MSSVDSKPVKKAMLEKDDAEDGRSLGSLLQDRKKKPSNAGSYSLSKVKKEVQGDAALDKTPKINSGSGSKGTKIKKEERFDNSDDSYDEKPGKKSSVAKRDRELKKKKKKVKEEEKIKTSKINQDGKKNVAREKKVYDLPGQKRDPPEERDSLRIFYETLYKQLPHSEMAQFWMMESGLLSKEEAKKVFEKKQKRAALQKISSPVKAVSVTKTVTKTATVKKKASCSSVSSSKKKTVDSTVTTKQSKKRKSEDGSSEDESDEDFIISKRLKKKQRAA